MSKQVIPLEIKDRSLTKLAGNSYGRKLFDAQVDGQIDLNEPFTIVFPEQIDYLASSFIQGFFGKIYTEIGREGMEKILMSLPPRFPILKNHSGSSNADVKDV